VQIPHDWKGLRGGVRCSLVKQCMDETLARHSTRGTGSGYVPSDLGVSTSEEAPASAATTPGGDLVKGTTLDAAGVMYEDAKTAACGVVEGWNPETDRVFVCGTKTFVKKVAKVMAQLKVPASMVYVC
jgi:hypothetical protein